MRLNFTATLLLVMSVKAMQIERVEIDEEQVDNLAEVEKTRHHHSDHHHSGIHHGRHLPDFFADKLIEYQLADYLTKCNGYTLQNDP